MDQSPGKTLLTTVLALCAFAANSILCRLALGEQSIDAASFTLVRLCSGALVLVVILLFQQGANSLKTTEPHRVLLRHNGWPALMLFVYAVTFSYAYITLDTGTGALILFGAVQLTMIQTALAMGERLHQLEWAGVITAFGGFIYLMWPAVSTPSFDGFVLMTLAGMAWGAYTLLGKGSVNPLADTKTNFVLTLPLVAVLLCWALLVVPETIHLSARGVIWAVVSGGLASGVGYTLWYTALRGLSSTQAAVGQLLVPVIAALGGIIFVGEHFSPRLLLSIVLILGGIGLVVWGRVRHRRGQG